MHILTGYRQPSYRGNTITASRFQVIAGFFLNRETKKPTSLSNDNSSAWVCHSAPMMRISGRSSAYRIRVCDAVALLDSASRHL
jgi:hypothetical protein